MRFPVRFLVALAVVLVASAASARVSGRTRTSTRSGEVTAPASAAKGRGASGGRGAGSGACIPERGREGGAALRRPYQDLRSAQQRRARNSGVIPSSVA